MSASPLDTSEDTNEFLSSIGFHHPSDFRDFLGVKKFDLSREAGYDIGTPNTVDWVLDKRLDLQLIPKMSLTRFEALRETGTLIYLTGGPFLVDARGGNHVFGELIRFNERIHGQLINPVINYALLATYCKANRLSDPTRDRLAETIRVHRSTALPSERKFVDYDSFQAN